MFDFEGISGPLRPEQFKIYDEHFALAVLQHCFGDEFKDFVVKDAPDLQDPYCPTKGIEVTRAVSEQDAKIDGENTRFRLGEKRPKDWERCRRLIEKNGGEINDIFLSYPRTTQAEEWQTIQKAIAKKSLKFSRYRSNGFEQMGLFVLFAEPLIPISVEEMFRRLKAQRPTGQEWYEELFFCSPNFLIRGRIPTDDWNIYTIGRNQYDRLAKNTRLIVDQKS